MSDDRDTKRTKIDNGLGFTLNGYKGYKLEDADARQGIEGISSEFDIIPTVEMKNLTQEKFYKEYVSIRKPCIINGYPSIEDWKHNFSYDTLIDLAGENIVQVEQRKCKTESFGKLRTSDRQIEMTMRSFLDRLCSSDELGENIYLTTQSYEDHREEGEGNALQQYLFSTPCLQMLEAGKIPIQPDLVGNLILQSCNLWMGRSKDGSSSGLHHDYHDNIYCLLRGRKQIRLYSPDQAENLATNGVIDRVYFNGRICYAGFMEVCADGRPIDADGTNSIEENDDGVIIGKGFDYVSSDEGDWDFDKAESDNFDNESENFGEDLCDTQSHHESDTQPIPSFSRIDLSLPMSTLENDFPQMKLLNQHIVNLCSGQLLYLPAGWFHEVTSYSESVSIMNGKETDVMGEKIDKLQHCHCALNYWFHPPDVLDNYNKPYQNDFWQKQFEKSKENLSRK